MGPRRQGRELQRLSPEKSREEKDELVEETEEESKQSVKRRTAACGGRAASGGAKRMRTKEPSLDVSSSRHFS